MKTLKELIQIVKDIELNSADFLTTNKKEKSKLQQLYTKVLVGDFTTDQEAAEYFYQTGPSSSAYKSLKYQLKNTLINTLFFYTPKDKTNDYLIATIYCSRYLLVGKLLLNLSAKNAGIDLCQKVLKKALEIEHSEYIVAVCNDLRITVSLVKGDIEKFNYYNNLHKKYKKIQDAENLADEYYCTLALPYVKSKEKKSDTHLAAKAYFEELSPLLREYSSPRLHMIGRLIEVVSYLAIHDYQTVINLCNEAYTFFKQKPYKYHTPLRLFSHHELISCIQLKDYSQGKKVVTRVLETVKRKIHGWYIHQELHLMLALHSKEYNAAYHILHDVVNSKNFSKSQPYIRERWEVYKIYIDFLIYIGRITVIEKQKFRIGKFLNSVPIYSKDKRGLNIPILIVQLLFMIVKKDYDQTFDRFEAIQKYCYRYVTKDVNLRSNCFINMLLQIPSASFHKAGVIRKAEKYYNQLLATPLDIAGQTEEIEIIPYEDIWEFIIESLEIKTYRAKT